MTDDALQDYAHELVPRALARELGAALAALNYLAQWATLDASEAQSLSHARRILYELRAALDDTA